MVAIYGQHRSSTLLRRSWLPSIGQFDRALKTLEQNPSRAVASTEKNRLPGTVDYSIDRIAPRGLQSSKMDSLKVNPVPRRQPVLNSLLFVTETPFLP